jgi:hypothetical protein
LAEVEKLAGAMLSPGFGDRVRFILTELDRRDAKPGTVEVVEKREHIPLLLRKLLLKLGATFGFTGSGTSKPAGIPGTDLRNIQQALTSPHPPLSQRTNTSISTSLCELSTNRCSHCLPDQVPAQFCKRLRLLSPCAGSLSIRKIYWHS